MKTISKNPVPRNGLFADKTLGELQDYIEQMSAKEKAFAYMIMTMTMNACHRLVNEAETEFSNTDDMIDSVNNIIHNHVQNMRKVGAEELGLDRRAGYAWVNDDYIVTDAGSRFDYYAGFEYVDADDVRKVGEYTFYSRHSDRIADCLDTLAVLTGCAS